jgi:uncharacterized protein (TIGR02270 family)
MHTPSNTSAMSAIGLKRALAVGEEAAFLWVSRSAVARSSAVTFDVLARLDARISELVIKLSERSELADRLLQHEPPAFNAGLAFVTAAAALRRGTAKVFEELVTRLESDVELLAPLASALAWFEYREVRPSLEGLLMAASPAAMQLGLAAAVAHAIDPGETLNRALDAEDATLRASAAQAAGRLGMRDLQLRLRATFESEEPACRFWASWSAVRLGDRAGVPILGQFAAQGGAFARPACEVALRALDTKQALRAQARLASNDRRLGALAAGIVGDPVLAPWLLDEMESPAVARAAGAAFCLITGCDLRRDDLDGPPPPVAIEHSTNGDETGDPTAVSVDPTQEDEPGDYRAWPHLARVRAWWDDKRHRFVPGSRYLAGRGVGSEGLMTVLRTGNQRQREAAALEFALRNPDAPLFDVTAPAHRQIAMWNRVSE